MAKKFTMLNYMLHKQQYSEGAYRFEQCVTSTISVVSWQAGNVATPLLPACRCCRRRPILQDHVRSPAGDATTCQGHPSLGWVQGHLRVSCISCICVFLRYLPPSLMLMSLSTTFQISPLGPRLIMCQDLNSYLPSTFINTTAYSHLLLAPCERANKRLFL